MTCPNCGAGVAGTARFCEACGSPVSTTPAASAPPAAPVSQGSPLAADAVPISALTRPAADALPDPPNPLDTRRPCADCGGEVGPDLYCMECGTKALSPRDHFAEQPADWVAGVCDKGAKKAANEDAMALLAAPQPGSRAVLIVLDGVSNSQDSAKASLAGARAAREVLRMPLPAGMGTPGSRASAAKRVFAEAVKAANTAISAVTDPDEDNPASATFAAAVLEDDRVGVASIGDSRAYWLPDDGEAQLLTVDDSLAQAQIAEGVAREVAETSPQAHAITKWLGRDAEDIAPRVADLTIAGPGWLLVCSDGLWNYASEPADLRERLVATGATTVADAATALVAFANESGGHDNITVALARLGPLGETGPGGSVDTADTAEATDQEPTAAPGEGVTPDG